MQDGADVLVVPGHVHAGGDGLEGVAGVAEERELGGLFLDGLVEVDEGDLELGVDLGLLAHELGHLAGGGEPPLRPRLSGIGLGGRAGGRHGDELVGRLRGRGLGLV